MEPQMRAKHAAECLQMHATLAVWHIGEHNSLAIPISAAQKAEMFQPAGSKLPNCGALPQLHRSTKPKPKGLAGPAKLAQIAPSTENPR